MAIRPGDGGIQCDCCGKRNHTCRVALADTLAPRRALRAAAMMLVIGGRALCLRRTGMKPLHHASGHTGSEE